MKHLDQKDWANQLAENTENVIIDVRTPEEWSAGIIENAILLNIFDSQNFIETMETLDKNKNYFIYCRSGARSGQACEIFNNNGIENAFNLLGGFMNWTGDSLLPSK